MTPDAARYDVVVVGGGPAGVPAAVQAARAGARTLLVEKNGALGGTTTTAGVYSPALFHAWGRQVIAGVGWDAVLRAVELAGTDLPDFTDWDRPHYKLQVRVTPVLLAAAWDEQVAAAPGLDLRLHTLLGAIAGDDGGWRLTLCGKEGLFDVDAACVVDATGDANVVTMAGGDVVAEPELQPGTLMVRVGGYDLGALDLDALEDARVRAVAAGTLGAADFGHEPRPAGHFLRVGGANSIHVTGIRATTSLDRTAAELAGRAALVRIVTFLRAQPGLERVAVEWAALETGIRETVRVRGRETITAADYTSGRLWPEAVSYSFFPLDIHRADAVDLRPLAYGTFPTIPRGALVPAGVEGMLVAGRTISGDRLASSAYRVQASCMAMGQAAGAVAALAVRTGLPVGEVPIDDVRAVLREGGAIVPGDPGSPHA